jgi:anti-sigma factor (TIGR02949 family)
VNCEHVHKVLDAYLDDELDEATTAQLTQHLGACPACASLVAERNALRAAIRQLPRHPAPTSLRRSIHRELESAGRVFAVKPPHALSWWQAGGLAGLAATLAFALGLWAGAPRELDLREQVIARHVASLAEPGQVVAVASTDRHVVKPWFAGKLDFAPPVRNLSEHGFTLVGGRVDELAGRPAAAIVYRLRKHEINLFVFRAATLVDQPMAASTMRGFALVSWTAGGLGFAVISDVDPRELLRFCELLRSAER